MPTSDWDRLNKEWCGSKRAILAYHMGGWRKGESPLKALARALEVGNTFLNVDTSDFSELNQLSACLDMDSDELSELSINESVVLMVALLNEKLEEVPPEVRTFFGAPKQLESLPINIYEERVMSVRA